MITSYSLKSKMWSNFMCMQASFSHAAPQMLSLAIMLYCVVMTTANKLFAQTITKQVL